MNAFAPPTAPAPARPKRRTRVAFVLRRALLHLGLPGLAALATLIREARWELAAAVFVGGSAVWAPTTIGLTWTRFFASDDDAYPVVLIDGDVMARGAYTRFQALSLVELGLLLVGLVGVAAQLVTRAWWTWPLAAAVLGFAAWAAWRARDVVRLSAAIVAHAGLDSDAVLRHARPLVARRSGVGDTARVLIAHAHLRRGDVDAALEALAGARHPVGVGTDLLAAQILLGRGETEPARRALATARIERPSVRWAREALRAHLDLTEGRGEAVLRRAAEAWGPLRATWPAPWVATLDLMEAAALAQGGDAEGVRRVLARIPDVDDRRWMAGVWPVFAFLGR